MDWLGLVSLFAPKEAPRVTQVTPPRISVAAIKSYDKMVMETASEKIKAKLEPLVANLSDEERARTIQIMEVVLTEVCEAIAAMEKVRGIR